MVDRGGLCNVKKGNGLGLDIGTTTYKKRKEKQTNLERKEQMKL